MLLEAMAQGTPVVSTAELGTKFVLKDGAGALVVPERVEDFAAAVERVPSDKGLQAMLAASGREYSLAWSSRCSRSVSPMCTERSAASALRDSRFFHGRCA